MVGTNHPQVVADPKSTRNLAALKIDMLLQITRLSVMCDIYIYI